MAETLKEAMERIKQAADIQAYANDHLERRGSGSYVCPFCDSGNGPKRSAAFHTYNGRYKCFSCGEGGDIFDLAGHLEGLTDNADMVDAVAAWAGVPGWERVQEAAQARPTHRTQASPQASTEARQKAQEYRSGITREEEAHEEGRAKARAYIEEARQRIGEPEAVAYLASRGINEETARAWGLGYDPHPRHGWQDARGTWHNGGRIVIPWAGCEWYHIDRACSDEAESLKYDKPATGEVGAQPLWNPNALAAAAFFVCEGALDALAIQACGYQAVALGNAGGSSLVGAMSNEQSPGLALLMLDFDEPKEDGRRPGQDGQEKLAAEMERAGLDCISLDTAQLGAKDAAELYAKDAERLASLLKGWHTQGVEERERRKAARYAEALKRLHVADAGALAASIAEFDKPVWPIATGFPQLDEALGGGLQPKNVHVLGAVPSMGKTSFALQVAEQIAAAGLTHCLFASIEQRASELVAKSLSRLLATTPDAEGRTHEATAQDLTVLSKRLEWSADMSNQLALEGAQRIYREKIAPRMHFLEGQQQPSVRDLRTIVETLAEQNGRPPVLIIDYLQLLAPVEGHDREDEKSLLKRNMLALRQLAGELDTPVFVLAALSREGGAKSLELDSFRDSSNIEFSSDVLMGLQLRRFRARLNGVDDKKRKYMANTLISEEKAKTVRELELVIIKNRGGELRDDNEGGLGFTFNAPLNSFAESNVMVRTS